jgi:hypothetical protein
VVIDNISTIFTAAYPPGMEELDRKGTNNELLGKGGKKNKERPRARRFAIIGDLITGLAKLAAAKYLAVSGLPFYPPFCGAPNAALDSNSYSRG